MSSLGVIIPPILGIYEIVWQGLEKKYITIMGTIIGNLITLIKINLWLEN